MATTLPYALVYCLGSSASQVRTRRSFSLFSLFFLLLFLFRTVADDEEEVADTSPCLDKALRDEERCGDIVVDQVVAQNEHEQRKHRNRCDDCENRTDHGNQQACDGNDDVASQVTGAETKSTCSDQGQDFRNLGHSGVLDVVEHGSVVLLQLIDLGDIIDLDVLNIKFAGLGHDLDGRNRLDNGEGFVAGEERIKHFNRSFKRFRTRPG